METDKGARAYACSSLLRITHWLNVPLLLLMTASRLQIWWAYPAFGPDRPHPEAVFQALRRDETRADPRGVNLGNAGLLAGVLSVLTGLAILKPARFKWLAWLFGGYQPSRFLHFSSGSFLMVISHGWRRGGAWFGAPLYLFIRAGLLRGWRDGRLPRLSPKRSVGS